MNKRSVEMNELEMRRFVADDFIRGALLVGIGEGKIDPTGKTGEEMITDFLMRSVYTIKTWGKLEARIATDFKPTLLQHARNFRTSKQENKWISCLFYATWAEHFFNGLIEVLMSHRGFDQQLTKRVIGGVQFHGKVSWLLPLLGARPISEKHQKVLLTLAKLRNGFVHYKWQYEELDTENEQETKLEDVLAVLEKTIRYLKRYEDRYILYGARPRIEKTLKKDSSRS
jgi:hypothetical protein